MQIIVRVGLTCSKQRFVPRVYYCLQECVQLLHVGDIQLAVSCRRVVLLEPEPNSAGAEMAAIGPADHHPPIPELSASGRW
jgi:hypothetical protein